MASFTPPPWIKLHQTESSPIYFSGNIDPLSGLLLGRFRSSAIWQ
jgi:hypothetical protein